MLLHLPRMKQVTVQARVKNGPALAVTASRILPERACHRVAVGKLKVDTPLPISTRAAIQHPTKLGLKANQTINVEGAIKGLVYQIRERCRCWI